MSGKPIDAADCVPQGVQEALQRLIENAATLGPASREDALLVARHRALALTAAQQQGQVVAWMTPGGDVSRSFYWCLERCLPGQKPQPLYTAPPSAPVGVEAMRRAVEEIESGDFGGGVSDACLSAMKAALAQQPAAAPCCMCGNPVDTRENGTPGAELTDGRWTCSHECFDKATAQHQEPTTTRP